MHKTTCSALAASLLLTGCTTYQPPAQQQAMRTRQTEDMLIQQENQRRMAGRIETLEMEITRLSREIDSLRQSVDSKTAALERKAEDDKQQMISRLSAQMAQLVKQATPPPTATQTPANSGLTGYEHIVQQGETLSAIAKAYDVTPTAIINANKLKNPNRLSIGQKLFIPE